MLDLYPENEPAENRAWDADSDLAFSGKPLSPFSMTRQSAALALGLRIRSGRLQQDDLREIKVGDETAVIYDGMDEDSEIVVYVMSLKDSECLRIRRESKEEAIRKFDHWREASQLGLFGVPERKKEAMDIFSKVINALMASESKPVIEKGSGTASEIPNG